MISTEKYQASHGKQPKGRGCWMFLADGELITIRGQMSFAKAKAAMLAKAAEATRAGRSFLKIEVAP